MDTKPTFRRQGLSIELVAPDMHALQDFIGTFARALGGPGRLAVIRTKDNDDARYRAELEVWPGPADARCLH